jgi:site-specific DNA-methyltransferase (adenine-specific)
LENMLITNNDCLTFLDELNEGSIDCIWTDPPYFLSNDGTTCQGGKRVKVNKGEWDRLESIYAMHQFNSDWLTKCYRVLKPGGTIWVSGTHHNIHSIGFAMQAIGYKILNNIVWEKTSPPPNLACSCFTHSYETIVFASKGKGYTFNYDWLKETNNGKQQKDILKFGRPTKEEKVSGKHPTQKPLSLVRYCLQASTNPGDKVLDPFMGSGTTGVAAIGLGLDFFGCEKDPEHYQLAQKRIEEEKRNGRMDSTPTG